MVSRHILSALACGAIVLACQGARAEFPDPIKVAFMYSGFNGGSKSFMNEHDEAFDALGWQCVKFENTQAEELTRRLGEFDVVVGSSVSNYENPQDFAPYAPEWMAFLERGGVIICTDASYTQLLDKWIGQIDPAFRATSNSCAEHLDPSPETRARVFDDSSALLLCPNDLRPAMRAKANWAHINELGPGWQTPVLCYDDKPLLAYRSVGEGMIVATSFFRMSGGKPESLGRGLLENACTCAQARRGGVEVTRLAHGEAAPGPNLAVVELANISEDALHLVVSVTVQHGDDPAMTREVQGDLAAGATRRFELAYETTARGPHSIGLAIASNTRGAFFNSQASLTVPEPITIGLATRHHYPHYLSAKPEISLAPAPSVSLQGARLSLQLVGEDVRGDEIVIESPEATLTAELPLAGLSPGEYQLIARLKGKRGVEYQASAPVVLHPKPRVRIESDNVCYVDDEPFFPLGMYMVTWSFEKDAVLECVRELAAAGFNTAHLGCKDFSDFEEVLDEAQRLGVRVIVEGLRDMATVERFKDHPAILAWNPGDEPDGHGVPAETVRQRIDSIKDVDPTRVTYTTLCVADEYDTYAPVTEVLSIDPYPVRKGKHILSTVGEYVDRARNAVDGRKPLWVVPQCFGGYSAWEVPSPAEERSMTYQALIHGANGLVYYTYNDSSFNVLEHPELWAEMKKLAAEVKALSPVLLGPTNEAVRFSAGAEDVIHGLAARDGQDLYLITVNAEDADAGRVALSVAGLPATGHAEVLFEGRSVDVVGGTITDDYGPCASHVYRVRIAQTQ